MFCPRNLKLTQPRALVNHPLLCLATLNKFGFDNQDTNYSMRNIPHMHHLRIQNKIGTIKGR
jgi:hypothetical protein